MSIDGRMMPVMHGQQTVATRADMRRTDSQFQFDNWLFRQLAGDGRSADIIRLDRSLVWTLHPAKRSYRECALSGCGSAMKPEPEKQPKDKEKPREPSEAKCPLTVKSNEFSVLASGEKKRINTFDTEQFLLKWKLEMQDPQKQVARNEVVLELWTTPENGQIRDVKRINESFEQRWRSATRPAEHPFGRYVPPDVVASMASLIRGAGTKSFAKWANDMKKIHGYPILTKMSWSASGNVCSDQRGDAKASASSTPTSVGGLLGGLIAGQATSEMADRASSGALLTFTHEVQTIAVKPVADTSFLPPPDYQKEATR
ncbi:hypothetical protein GCM10025771_35630 [Niveibacterium umoris]|uniref:Uncharacterized protein n=1 Tax=Niveibacterium umoris TaxID=1193620 RepID=A0A840BDY8_9RHOO|nr:hypothetical protein [Niveibacterium umoris]MBB4011240.1 hypothetical protein [Niveibacterium umoris]